MKEKMKKNKLKRTLSWIMVVVMTFGLVQGLSIAGLLGRFVDAQAADSLKDGEYIYVHIDDALQEEWLTTNMITAIAYAPKWNIVPAGSTLKDVLLKMEEVKDKDGLWYRAKFPAAFFENTDSGKGEFKIVKVSEDYSYIDAWIGDYDRGNGNFNITDSGSKASNTIKIVKSSSYRATWQVNEREISGYGNQDLYFYNMDTALGGVKAIFSSSISGNSETIEASESDARCWKFTIPAVEDEYDKVEFVDDSGNHLETVQLLNSSYAPEDNRNTYYYKSVVDAEGTVGVWGRKPESNPVSGTLYFDNVSFPVGSVSSLEIGGVSAIFETAASDSGTYVCDVPSGSSTDTIITLEKMDGTKYNFMWSSSTYNDVVITAEGVAAVEGNYYMGDKRTIYFDSSMSKLSYSDASGDSGIPSKDGTIKYYAARDASGTDAIKGNMTKVQTVVSESDGYEHQYTNVYRVDLPLDYKYIAFSNFELTDKDTVGISGSRTDFIEIPDTYDKPCFYANSGDDIGHGVYESNTTRGGHWDDAFTVNKNAADNLDYADSMGGTEEKKDDVKYVTTTFYDYYSDLELNGFNRSIYGLDNSGNKPGNGYTNRTYMPNRIFNMALSDYYSAGQVSDPLYFGHFQWLYSGSLTNFKNIAPDLDLYQYDGDEEDSKFYYNNNSQYRRNGVKGTQTSVATQGLVYDKLTDDGRLQLKEDVIAPYFDAGFLSGDNTYNIALGKVYNNVTFPFTKDSDGYWSFDSRTTNLRMTNDNGNYFLKSTDVNSLDSTTMMKGFSGGPTSDSNFFPFNSNAESGQANKLNYGFGMRMDIDFALPESGQINIDGVNKDIEFEFSGDDDIWIFIDNQLVLDLGGSHGRVKGTLNFSTKKAGVDLIKTPDGQVSGEGANAIDFTLNEDIQVHTLTIYYMERGMWESNMSIKFNFPEYNTFTVDKTVKTDNLNENITEATTNVTENIKKLEFDFGIENLATNGGSVSVADMNSYLENIGFEIDWNKISDYGSVSATDGRLKPANGATYYVEAEKKQVSDGVISLTDGQEAAFINMFRKGSYLRITEQAGNMMKDLSGSNIDISDIFSTEWTIKGYDDNDKNNGTGISPEDNRREEDYSGAVSNQIADGYLDNNSTILFRNYANAKSTAEPIKTGVSYVNTFKTGSIVIEKLQAESYTADLDDNTEYEFEVVLDNIAGLHLEDTIVYDDVSGEWKTTGTDSTITIGNIKLKKGESHKIEGIPVGTQYTIREVSVSDASSLAYVKRDGTNLTVANNSVTDAVEAKDEIKTFQFYNSIPQYQVIYYTQVTKQEYDSISNAADKRLVEFGTGEEKYNKYFKKETTKVFGPASLQAGDEIEHDLNENGQAGVKLKKNGTTVYNPVSDTYQKFEGYLYNEDTTVKAGRSHDTATVSKTATVELYYELTSYSEKYYIESADQTITPDGELYIQIGDKIYKRQETVLHELEKIGKEVTVTDKSAIGPYNKYERLASLPPQYPSAATVNENGTTVVYQVYGKVQAAYTVEYYKEVDDTDSAITGDRITVNGVEGKRYVKADSRVENASVNDLIEYAVSADDKAGVTHTAFDTSQRKEVEDTFKSYTNYEFNENTTIKANRISATVVRDNSAVIQLYFEKQRAAYTEEYYIEVDEKEAGGKYIEDTEGRIYKRVYSEEKTGEAVGKEVTVKDRQNDEPYRDYDLVSIDDTKYPSTGSVKKDGTLIVYQIYRKKEVILPETAKYTVKYFRQTDEATYDKTSENDRRKISDGKFFIKASDSILIDAEVGQEVTYDVDSTGAAGVTRNGVKEAGTYKSFDNYVFSRDATVSAGNAADDVKSGDLTVIELYYEKIPAKFTVEYYLQTDKAEYDKTVSADKDLEKDFIGGKYFIRQTDKSIVETEDIYAGDTISASSRTGGGKRTEAGVVVVGFEAGSSAIERDKTYKSFAGYEYSSATTILAKQHTDKVDRNGTAVIRLYYEKKLASYTEEYYTEVFEREDGETYITVEKDGKIKLYKRVDINVKENQETDKEVTITDRSGDKKYEDYKLITSTEYTDKYPQTAIVKEDGSTVVYQIYDKKPVYTVEYYVEVDKDTYNTTDEDKRDTVDDKYFIRKEIVTRSAAEGDIVRYDHSGSNKEAGIKITDKEGTRAVDGTYKSYDNYEFSPDTTETAKAFEGKISVDDTVTIKLYYESVLTSYTEKYYVQLSDEEAKGIIADGENYIELKIDGVTYIFKKQEQNVVDNQKAGWTAKVTDKETENEYSDYELITVNVDGYPVDDVISENGTTVLYQIYRIPKSSNPQETTTPEPTAEETTTPKPTTEETTTPEPTTAEMTTDEQTKVTEETTREMTEIKEGGKPEKVTTSQTDAEAVSQTTAAQDNQKSVKTGDKANVMLWICMFVSALIAAAVIINRRREQD